MDCEIGVEEQSGPSTGKNIWYVTIEHYKYANNDATFCLT